MTSVPRGSLLPSLRLGLVAVLLVALLAVGQGPASAQEAVSVCPPGGVPEASFLDRGTTHAEAIDCLTWLGVVGGFDATTFGTDRRVTRGQLATMLGGVVDLVPQVELPAATDPPFVDTATTVHRPAIASLAATDPTVLTGFPDGTYRPNADVTRAQATALVVRTHALLASQLDELDPLAPGDGSFDDTAESVHAESIAAAAAAGLVTGVSETVFHPNRSMSRGQLASVLHRHLELLASAGVLVPDPGPDPDPDPDPTGNPWLDTRRIANIAHAGGIHEAPQNTLYAFATAGERGADVLEMDLQVTADGHVVVIHDSTVNRTTDGQGCVVSYTLDELRELDAAYTHVDGEGPRTGRPDDEYLYRGIATGDVAPPEGFAASDFRIPTLAEVFERHAGELMNIELKSIEAENRDGQTWDCPALYEAMDPEDRPDIAAEVARLIDEYDVADTVLVASFIDTLMARFVQLAPDVDTSFPLGQGIPFYVAFLTGNPNPPNPDGHVALQVPMRFQFGDATLDISEEFVQYAQANGVAVHIWTINDLTEMELLLDWGVDGIITDRVRQLDELLTAIDAPRP